MGVSADVVVHQLQASYGNAVINVNSKENGVVGVWGHAYQSPTYLLVSGYEWTLLVFNDEDWAEEGLAQYAYRWKAECIYELPSMKDVTSDWIVEGG